MTEEAPKIKIVERAVLRKFDGEPGEDNWVEEIILEDGVIVEHNYRNKEEPSATD